MSTLATIVLAAITSVAKGPVAKNEAHLAAIANDIAHVAVAQAASPFAGDDSRAGLALALVAIAKHESEFDPKVDTCARRGDLGRSITLFQLNRGPNWGGHSDAVLCRDRKLAARLAATLFARPATTLPHATPQMLANAYASGSPARGSRAAKEICALWERLAKGAGLARATCAARKALGSPPGLGDAPA